ncbi:MAG: helix-turn-helix domain-containing protein [bacterium]|nr:helix-turn-helix domain-containing protein [bacterium]
MLEEIVRLLKGLSDQGRLRTLVLIANNGELNVQQVALALQLPFSTASRYLRTLEIYGWLTSRRESRWIYYRCRNFNSGISTLKDHLFDLLNEEELLMEDTQRLFNQLAKKETIYPLGKKNQTKTKREKEILPPLPPFSLK